MCAPAGEQLTPAYPMSLHTLEHNPHRKESHPSATAGDDPLQASNRAHSNCSWALARVLAERGGLHPKSWGKGMQLWRRLFCAGRGTNLRLLLLPPPAATTNSQLAPLLTAHCPPTPHSSALHTHTLCTHNTRYRVWHTHAQESEDNRRGLRATSCT